MIGIELKRINGLIGFWESFSESICDSLFSDKQRMTKVFFWRCGCRGELHTRDSVILEPCERHYDLFMEAEIDDGISFEDRKKILELFDR